MNEVGIFETIQEIIKNETKELQNRVEKLEVEVKEVKSKDFLANLDRHIRLDKK